MLSKPHSLIGRRDFLLTSALTAGAIGALLPSSAAHAGGGNWNPEQDLKAGRVEWPTGPVIRYSAETTKWVEAWVVQQSTGASQKTFQQNFPDPAQWLAKDGLWIHGNFEEGWALGIALLAAQPLVPAQNGPAQTSYWWVDTIYLRPSKAM